MSASRLLILGVVRFMQPVHGYDIRREIAEWRAEQWANISYGSIYFALKKLTEDGLLEPVETGPVGNRPARTTYRMTERGEKEFLRLLREYWWDYKPTIDPFQVALTFMPALPREEILAALRHRIQTNRAWASTFDSLDAEGRPLLDHSAPRHIVENFRLARAHVQAELDWAESAIEKINRGDLP